MLLQISKFLTPQCGRGQRGQKRPQTFNVGLFVLKECLVMGAAKRQQRPGFIRRCIYRLAMAERDDLIIATVNDEHRASNVLNVITCCMSETAQPACGKPWIDFLGDIRHRRKGRFDDERQRLVPSGQP